MERRTANEIERDYKTIRAFINDNPSVTSFKEIAEGTDLTESKVTTSLEKHPRVYTKVKQQISANAKAALEAKNAANAKKDVSKSNEQDEIKVVIDASITGISSLHEILAKICASKAKIVLTSITFKTLEKMKRYDDLDGNDAKAILEMAAKNSTKFELVIIEENDTPANCIIKYCADNKENSILLTANKKMAEDARNSSIEAHYLVHTKNFTDSCTPPPASKKQVITTLFGTRKIGNKLFISDFKTDFRHTRVISKGTEQSEGICELKLGDEVYVAKKNPDNVTFAHYQVISLASEKNCKLIFSRRFFNMTEIENLPDGKYKSFLHNFKRSMNL